MTAEQLLVPLHPSGNFVYAPDLRGRIYGYRINRSDGSLIPLANLPLTIGGQATSATCDRQGRFLYVGNSGDNKLYAYRIEAGSGALTPVDGSPFTLGAAPSGIAFHPAGLFLYVSSAPLSAAGGGGIHCFTVDGTSGVPTEVATSPFATTLLGGQLVMHPNGKFLYDGVGGVHAFSIDPTSGTLIELDGSPHPGSNSDSTAMNVAVDPLGQYLYTTDMLGTVTGYRVDATTGAFERVPGSPFDARPAPYSVTVDPSGRFVYVGNDAELVTVFALQRSDGSLQPVGTPITARGLQPEIAISVP